MTDYDPTGEPTVLIASVYAKCTKCGFEQIEKVYGPCSGLRCTDFQAIIQSRYEGWGVNYKTCPECSGYYGNGYYDEGDDE